MWNALGLTHPLGIMGSAMQRFVERVYRAVTVWTLIVEPNKPYVP